jgi:hypothetical protein
VLYSAEQYARDGWPYPAWRPGTALTWVRGTALADGKPVALPAGLVHLSRALPRPEDALVQSTSNGLAAGATLEDALLGALCELVERDAVMITWLNRLPATELDLATAGGPAAAVARHYAALGVEVRCFVLPTDLPATVVLALGLEDAPDRPATVAAAGCSPSPAVAGPPPSAVADCPAGSPPPDAVDRRLELADDRRGDARVLERPARLDDARDQDCDEQDQPDVLDGSLPALLRDRARQPGVRAAHQLEEHPRPLFVSRPAARRRRPAPAGHAECSADDGDGERRNRCGSAPGS